MSASFTSLTALIIGDSKGSGAAASLLLAQNGANAAFNYCSGASCADAIVEKIGSDRALTIKGDTGSIPAIE